MGVRNTGGGVEVLKTTIRLRFMWQGQRRTPDLKVAPTPRNRLFAEKAMASIHAEIRAGTFDYARHFPDSAPAAPVKTFKVFAQEWLATVVADYGTKRGYAQSLAEVWTPALGDKLLTAIRPMEIKAIIAQRAEVVTGKTINNNLIPLRGVFDAAMAEELIAKDPLALIKNLDHQSPPPDPFEPDEVLLILADLKERAPIEVWAYYQFAFATGLRPSEQIVARWDKLSLRDETLLVDQARTRNKEKGTKTKTARTIDLTPPALAALAAMKAVTFMRGPEAKIFCHPSTGRPWTNDQYQRVTYFHPALRRLGIRKRGAVQTRHTFATMALMGDNVNPAYVARQMGHTDTRMFFTVYSAWIDGADKGRQKARLAASWPGAGHGNEAAVEKKGKRWSE